ncbi:uroporphyrinogen decarboxylase [Anaerotaenia torta]|uniref:uroporphyrinogen decarboxylase family protein n=1 Tax=Anaerotaenia torta TaxID=433293 RepID=UPI003D1CFCE5
MNMKQWVETVINATEKKAIPVLSFPCISLMEITVNDLINDSDLQAKGMKLVADKVPTGASVSMMDLSVEAEAFGSTIRFSDDEVPTVIGKIVDDEDAADALEVPEVGAGRTGKYIEAIEKVCRMITDRPVLAGIIGPFSLAGRLMDVSEAMINCYEEPDMVHTVMKKTAQFLTEYAKAYKAVGANGIVMAEPLTGLLSPDLAREFSAPYVKEIIDAVQDENFAVIYHNCGNNVIRMVDSIIGVGAYGYHFGNSITMSDIIDKIPSDALVMGNVDPAGQLRNGTPASIKAETKRIMEACCSNPNFVISSGCDIPPASSWENIEAFFEAVGEFYLEKKKAQ